MTIWPWSPVLRFYWGVFQYICIYFVLILKQLIILKKLIKEFYTLKRKEKASQLPLLTSGNGWFKVPEWSNRRNPNTPALPVSLRPLQAAQGMNNIVPIRGNSALGIFDSPRTNMHDSLGPHASMADWWHIDLCGKARGKRLLHRKTCL